MDLKDRVGNLTLANQLTFLRLVAVPFFVLAILTSRLSVAFWLFVGAGVTDLLDGLIARVFGQRTSLGTYLDPAADKLLVTAAFIVLTDYPTMFQELALLNRIPIWLTILTISRDVLIVAISLMLYLAYDMTRFPPTILGKLTAGAELLTVGLFLLFNWLRVSHILLDLAVWTTLTLTLCSGFQYLWRTVRQIRVEDVDTPPAG